MNMNRQLITRGLRPLLGVAAALLLGLGLLVGPGVAQAASNPTAAAQTVYNYWAAIERHDYPAAYEQFAATYRQDHGYERFALTQWSSVQQAGNIHIVREAGSAGRLYVTAQVDLTPGLLSPYPAGANTFVYSLVDENGAWRIEHVTSSAEDLAPAPPAPVAAGDAGVFVLVVLFAALFGSMTAGALLQSDRAN
jgi:hypothetical protein